MIDLTKAVNIDIKVQGGDTLETPSIQILNENELDSDVDDTPYDLTIYTKIVMLVSNKVLFSTEDNSLQISTSYFSLHKAAEAMNLPKLSHSYVMKGYKTDGTIESIAYGLFIVV
jgi:hypothetical protein